MPQPDGFAAASQGTRRIYRLRPEGFLVPNIWLDQFWNLQAE